MSIFSTRCVTADDARAMLAARIYEVLGKVPYATNDDLAELLNDYVSGVGDYWCTNFMVTD